MSHQPLPDKSTSIKIAEMLLSIGAVKFNPTKPFIWTSGWHSPIYCDSRLSISYPEIRSFIKENFAQVIRQHFSQTACIAGVASAGVPQAALVADVLELPMVYVRPTPKAHGLENLIEGKLEKGQKVILVEDIISTGGSSLKAVQAVRAAGAEVLAVLAIMSYHFETAQQAFEEAKVPCISLTNYNYLLAEYARQHDLSENLMASLQEWRNNPAEWKNIETIS